uniref:APCDDC domain-containing protein n=1 Tax=Macrostomum lignano TaxID=282301 RepID=A0A1I8JMR7_9PLAT
AKSAQVLSFVTRRYQFIKRYALQRPLQFYYSDSSCRDAFYGLETRGYLKVEGNSLSPAYWDGNPPPYELFRLRCCCRLDAWSFYAIQKKHAIFCNKDPVTAMPYTESAAKFLQSKVTSFSAECRRRFQSNPLESDWSPGGGPYHLLLYVEYRGRVMRDFDCSRKLGFNLHEMQLVRTELGAERRRRLYLGDLATDFSQRHRHRPSSFQEPLEEATLVIYNEMTVFVGECKYAYIHDIFPFPVPVYPVPVYRGSVYPVPVYPVPVYRFRSGSGLSGSGFIVSVYPVPVYPVSGYPVPVLSVRLSGSVYPLSVRFIRSVYPVVGFVPVCPVCGSVGSGLFFLSGLSVLSSGLSGCPRLFCPVCPVCPVQTLVKKDQKHFPPNATASRPQDCSNCQLLSRASAAATTGAADWRALMTLSGSPLGEWISAGCASCRQQLLSRPATGWVLGAVPPALHDPLCAGRTCSVTVWYFLTGPRCPPEAISHAHCGQRLHSLEQMLQPSPPTTVFGCGSLTVFRSLAMRLATDIKPRTRRRQSTTTECRMRPPADQLSVSADRCREFRNQSVFLLLLLFFCFCRSSSAAFCFFKEDARSEGRSSGGSRCASAAGTAAVPEKPRMEQQARPPSASFLSWLTAFAGCGNGRRRRRRPVGMMMERIQMMRNRMLLGDGEDGGTAGLVLVLRVLLLPEGLQRAKAEAARWPDGTVQRVSIKRERGESEIVSDFRQRHEPGKGLCYPPPLSCPAQSRRSAKFRLEKFFSASLRSRPPTARPPASSCFSRLLPPLSQHL